MRKMFGGDESFDWVNDLVSTGCENRHDQTRLQMHGDRFEHSEKAMHCAARHVDPRDYLPIGIYTKLDLEPVAT